MANSVRLVPRELRNANFPEARFLNEEEHTKYLESCKSFGEIARKNLDIDGVSLKGSNLFKIILLNQMGIRTATLHELDLIAEVEPNMLNGFYEDATAVALRSVEDSYAPNDYLAKSLAKLIHKKSFPHTVVIEGLKLREDQNSSYGLSFEKGDKFSVVEAPDFDHKNNGRNFKIINPDYTIDFDDRGERTFYTKDSGLSRLFLGRDLDLNSNNDNLGNSKFIEINESSDGRIAHYLWLGYNMITYTNLYSKIYSLLNLITAWKRARKGKTKKDL